MSTFYRFYFQAVVALALGMFSRQVFAADLLVADFQTTNPSEVTIRAESASADARCVATQNSIDQTAAIKLLANLSGPAAGWAGVILPVRTGEENSGADTIEFDAKAEAQSGALFITLNERDGSRWNASVKLDGEWQHFAIPSTRFAWFSGPPNRRHTQPRFENIVAVNPWVGAMFQGENGFSLDNVKFRDTAPQCRFHILSESTVPLQNDTSVTIEAINASGQRANFSGEIFAAVKDRKSALLPERFEVHNGVGAFNLFARNPGDLGIYLYEPLSRTEQKIVLNVVNTGLYVQFGFDGFEGEQVTFPLSAFSPKLLLQGETSVPLSAHISFFDHRNRLIYAINQRVADLVSGSGKIMVPQAGLLTAEIKVLAEPISSLPHITDNQPLLLSTNKQAIEQDVADGITTTIVMGSLVKLEGLPTSCTVLGQDRFLVFAIASSPFENTLYKSAFGLCSGALFHLTEKDIATTGMKRLRWHRKLGSFWGRNDLWWNEIEPTSGTFTWFKGAKVVNAYRDNHLRLLGILDYGAAWDKSKPPASSEALGKWTEYVDKVVDNLGNRIAAYEIWNEPNGTFKPDASDYRELMKRSFETIRKRQQAQRVIAGATAGYDPVFLDEIMRDGYSRYFDGISYHPYPERRNESPEDNYFDKTIDGVLAILDKNHASRKEIWITELGWPTCPAGVDEFTQANYLTRVYATALAKGVRKLFWFDLFDWEKLPWQGDWDAHLGLLDSEYSFKPSAISYNLVEYMMAHMNPKGIRREGKATICSFEIMLQRYKWPGIMHIAWTNHPGEVQSVEIPMISGGPVYALDYLGAERPGKLVSIEKVPGAEPDDHASTASIETKHNSHGHPGHDKLIPGTWHYVNADDTSGFPFTEPLLVGDGDAITTRTYRFEVTNEPTYIWDSGPEPKRREHHH